MEGDRVAVLASDLSRATVRLGRILRSKQASAVSSPQISALAGLSTHGPMTPGALAQYERVKPPSMTRVLGLLEDAGLIVRDKHPTDGRQMIVSISPLGEETLATESFNREQWLRQRIAQLSGADQQALRVAVRILKDLASE